MEILQIVLTAATGSGVTAIILALLQRKWTKDDKRDAIVDALKVLKDVNGIAQCYFTDKDVVRHRLVQEIVKAYERAAHPAADAKNKENNKNFK